MNKRKLQNEDCKKKYFLKKQNAITLIALVISIIIMLILAGVSLNATIGENGIMTQAKNATYMQSIAILEEYLQNEYVKYYDSMNEYDNKIDAFMNNANTKKYFQRAKNGDYYFLDPNSYKEYYFIEKSALPNEIITQIRDGENSLTGKSIYTDFNDLYGITKDLKVYYCSKDNRLGATDSASVTDLEKVIFTKENDTSWINALGFDNDVTLNDIRTITELNITDSDLDFSKLGNLGSLQKVTFTNIERENLSGIQDAININYIYFKNCKINDYSALRNLNGLQTLYLLQNKNNIDSNEELKKLCDAEKGIGGIDYPKLEYFGTFGVNPIYQNTFTKEQTTTTKSNLNDITCLENLSTVTKKAIRYLLINNNKITNLSVIRDFTNIYILRTECNELATLEGIEDMNAIEYLFANANKLIDGENEKSETNALSYLKNNNKLRYVNLTDNINLKYVSYLKNYNKITQLYLSGCENMNSDSLYSIVNIINNCGKNYSIPNKYTLLLLNENTNFLNLSGQTLSEENFKLIKNYKNITTLKLECISLTDSSGKILNSEDTNKIINDTLKELTNLKYLSIKKISSITSIDFIKNMKKLVEIDLRGTGITDLTLLNNLTTIRQFLIDNESINLTTIQQVISRCTGSAGLNSNWGSCGISLGGKVSLIRQLEECTELTSLVYSYQDAYNANARNYTLDLSKCNKLKYLRMNKPGLYTVILPTSLEEINFYYQSANGFIVYPNLSNLPNLRSIRIQASGLNFDGYKKIFSELSGNESLEEFYDNEYGEYGVTAIPDNINLPNLKILDLQYWAGSIATQSLDLSGFYNCNLPKLQKLYLRGQAIKSLAGIENLTSLEYLALQENKLTSLKELENLKKLQILNLENNTIYDNFQEKDENGNLNFHKNLEIIKNLHTSKGGKLEKIYLNGNNNITDWSIISKLKWTDKSGF